MARRLSGQTVVRAVPEMLRAALATAGAGSDNVTALAIMWQGAALTSGAASLPAEHMSTVVSTETLAEDQGGTTILGVAEADAAVPEVDAFNDAEIEKAIAEIRAAIEKSTNLLTRKDNNDL